MIEKLNEMLFFVLTILAGAFGWIIKTIRSDTTSAHKRIDDMERRIITKENLESALSPLRNDVNLILKTLLERKK
jgi:hypothetical protein